MNNDKNLSKRSYIVALSASIVNSYDYALFGLLAGKLAYAFFPSNESIGAIFNYFIVYASTLVIRPFASLFFGIIGDKYGRAKVLKIGSIGIALPVFVIALIPSFEQIGYAATIIFIICRLMILTFLSGEADGIRIYIYEKMHIKRKYFGSGLVTACSQAGALIAASATWLSSLHNFPNYIWRFNFLAGGIAGIVILTLRNSFSETEEFLNHLRAKDNCDNEDVQANIFSKLYFHYTSLINILKLNKKEFIKSIFVQGSIGGIYHFNIIFYSIYLINILNFNNVEEIELVRICTICAYMLSAIVSGVILDSFNPVKTALGALYGCILLTLANIHFISIKEYNPWTLISLGALTPLYTSAVFIFIKKQFATGVKYRLFGFTHSLGSVLISSTTPIVAIKIYENTRVAWAPHIYLITLLSILIIYVSCYRPKNVH